jgi:hypothetical protein
MFKKQLNQLFGVSILVLSLFQWPFPRDECLNDFATMFQLFQHRFK